MSLRKRGKGLRERKRKRKGKKMQGRRIKVVAERTIKIKKGKVKLREAYKAELAKKGSRAGILINKLVADPTVVWRPTELDEIAEELRSLAFQIKFYQDAKLATEEA